MKLSIIFMLTITLVAGRDLQDFFPSCQNELDVGSCLLTSLESIRSRVKYGIKEMGIPPLDPYVVDYLDIDTELPNVRIKCAATNINMYGASDFSIPYFRIDNRTYAFEMKIELPYLTVTADYNMKGTKVSFIKLSGQGQFKGMFNGVTAIIRGLMRPVTRINEEALVIDTLSTDINFGHSALEIKPMTNSFLSRAAAAYINSRPAAIINNLAPQINEYVAPKLKDYLNRLLEAVSTDRLVVFKQ